MSGGLDLLVGIVTGAALFVCCCWVSYVIAARITGTAAVATRWSGAVVVAHWLFVVSFTVLALLSAFRLWIALGVWIAGAVLIDRTLAIDHGYAALLRRDLIRVGRLGRALWRTHLRWLLLAVTVVTAARVLRGLAAPPLGWDALTYHLLKAGRWVQTGGFVHEAAPDAWSCYEYYPYTGEILSAWGMLPVHGDALLASVGLLTWLSVLLGAYALARELGAVQWRATLIALVVGVTPAVATYITTAYVDNTTLAVFLFAAVFVQRTMLSVAKTEALLVAAALGIAAGVKFTAAPLAVIGLVPIIVAVLRREAPWQHRLLLIAACAIAAAVALPPYLRTWVYTGNPLYPTSLVLGGKLIFRGNQMFALVTGPQLVDLSPYSRWYLLESAFAPQYARRALGPAALLVIAIGIFGAGRLAMARDKRIAVGFLVLSAIVTVSLTMSLGIALRTKWALSSVRFLTPAFAAMAVLGAGVPSVLATAIWSLTVVLGLYYGFPLGWGSVDVTAVTDLLLGVGAAAVVALLTVVWYQRRRHRAVVAIVAAGLVLTLSIRLSAVRDRYRYRYYAAVAANQAFDAHLLGGWTSNWPIWLALDDGPAHRVAATAGWNGSGDNWFRYPLLGHQLQNTVLYVPPTHDGKPLDYSLETNPAARVSFEAWVARLRQERIDSVVAIAPAPIEKEWMDTHPELFAPLASGLDNFGWAYRFAASDGPLLPAGP